MKKYTIYCTQEQTKRAFELGAPIEYYGVFVDDENLIKLNGAVYRIPTAEQMIGWLREKGALPYRASSLYMISEKYADNAPMSGIDGDWQDKFVSEDIEDAYETGYKKALEELTDKQTILVAIDAALDYLEEKGNNNDENY